jgi:hypothetical protein
VQNDTFIFHANDKFYQLHQVDNHSAAVAQLLLPTHIIRKVQCNFYSYIIWHHQGRGGELERRVPPLLRLRARLLRRSLPHVQRGRLLQPRLPSRCARYLPRVRVPLGADHQGDAARQAPARHDGAQGHYAEEARVLLAKQAGLPDGCMCTLCMWVFTV